MSYKIISGMSQQYYHTVPDDLDLITTTPTREGIFKYLSQIGYDKFPEFILDILLKIERHTAIDVTDGQGDEKQDILTLNPEGVRCLTQCKHTVDYTSHYNGDDLDLLVSACMRKNCKETFFVTNSDLTPQGKKYVTDEEYNRGFNNPDDCPKIEYWNGFRIWEKIKNNQDIINKWFSGLGQVHGLRSFKFDMTIQELPFDKTKKNESAAFDKILGILSTKSWIKEIINGLHYEAIISADFTVNLKRWFQYTGGLDINFVLPDDDLNFINRPLYALTIEVIMHPSLGKYSPKLIQEKIVKKIAEEILTTTRNDSWWHITTSQIKSIIYLHDISEPREINLTSASTFLKTNSSPTQNENDYCSLSENKFTVTDEPGDSIWLHKKTKIQVVQMFEQKINPVEHYNYQIQQYHQLNKIAAFNFYAIEKIDSSMMMRVRRLLNPEWIAFQHNDDAIIWAVDPSLDDKKIKFYHDKISAVGLRVLQVKKKDAAYLLKNCQKDLVPSSWMYTSDRTTMSFPIILNKRIFWLSKALKINRSNDIDIATELLKFKYAYEKKYGFDYMNGKTQQNINSLEIREILFDFFTIRGKRMLDISVYNNPISINIRFAEGRLESSNTIALNYIEEFKQIYIQINKILN